MTIETPARQTPLPFLYNIQALRGVAAILVLLSHLYIIEAKSTSTPILTDLWDGGRYGVDLFFVISGFIMVYVTRPFRGAGPSISAFLYARITRIYPLYWLVSAALLGVYLWRPDMVFSSAGAPPDLVKSFALWPDDREPLLAVGWTLVHEMGFYALFALSLLLARRWLAVFLAIWGAGIVIGNLLGAQAISPLLNLLFHPLSFEFLAGAFIALYFENRGAGLTAVRSKALYWALAAIGVLCVVLLPRYTGLDPAAPNAWPRVGIMIVPSALTVWALARLDWAGARLPAFMSRLGDWSYALYLSHVLTLGAVGKIWIMLGWSGAGVSLLMLSVMIVTALIFAALLHYGFERPVLSITRKFIRANRR